MLSLFLGAALLSCTQTQDENMKKEAVVSCEFLRAWKHFVISFHPALATPG